MAEVNIALALFGALAGFIVICTQPRMRIPIIVTIGTLLIALASSWIVDEESSFSVALRVLGAAAFVLASIVGPRLDPRPLAMRWGIAFLAPIALFLIFATLVHDQLRDFVAYGIGLLVLAVVITSLPRIPLSSVRSGTRVGLLILASSSLILGIVMPSEGLEGGRLRGIFENANSLGFFAFLAVAAALFVDGKRLTTFLLLTTGSIALILTGSRASLLAVLICLAGWLIYRLKWAGWALLFTGLIFGDAVVSWVSSLSPELELLLRNNNSRDESLRTALDDWSSSPFFGVGLNGESDIIASTPLRALAQGGSFGFAAIVLLWASVMILAFRSKPPLRWLSLAAIAHSLFEGWMLSPVSPLLMLFVILWWCVYGDGASASNVSKGKQSDASVAHSAGRGIPRRRT